MDEGVIGIVGVTVGRGVDEAMVVGVRGIVAGVGVGPVQAVTASQVLRKTTD
jgi:hypothetical protein